VELIMNAITAISSLIGSGVKPVDSVEPTQTVQDFQWSLQEAQALWASQAASADGDGLPAVVGAMRDRILPLFERRSDVAELAEEVSTGSPQEDVLAFFEQIKEKAGEEREHHLTMQLIITAFTGLISTMKMLLRG